MEASISPPIDILSQLPQWLPDCPERRVQTRTPATSAWPRAERQSSFRAITSLPMLLRVILAPSHNRVSGVFALLFQAANSTSKWEKIEIEFLG
jgi:hypothetical protein